MKITLRSARANVGLTAKEVANKIGVSQLTILQWEKGNTQPPIDKVLEMCSLYEIDIENIRFKQIRKEKK